MKKSARSVLSMILAVGLLFSMVACGSAPVTPLPPSSSNGEDSPTTTPSNTGSPVVEKKVITTWNGFTGSDGSILKEIVDRYNAENTDGVIVKMDIIPWDNYFEKLPQAIATGTAPDFVLQGSDQLGNFCSNDSFQPVEDFFDSTGYDKSQIMSVLYDMFTYNGKLMGIPMNTFGRYLYWNKSIFKEKGLDPETPPKTWDELFEVAKKTTDPSKNYFGVAVPVQDNTLVMHYLMGNGISVVDAVAKKSTINAPEAINLITKLQDITMKQRLSPASTTGPSMDQVMFAGQLALYINGPWLVNGLRENGIDFGITTIPAGSAGQQGMLDGTGFSIPKTTSEENKQLAYKFIKYWSSPEICKEWSLRNGFPPFVKGAVNDPEVKADLVLSELTKSLDYAKPFLVGMITPPKLQSDAISPAMENILYGGADVKKELDACAASMDQILATEP